MIGSVKKMCLSAAVAVLAISSVASAGNKFSQPAYVGVGYAGGALGSTRNSSGTKDYVSAMVRDNSWAWFMVVDINGKSASCTTTDPELIALARSINSSSSFYIEFDKLGACTSVTINHASYFEPPLP
jgi:hypothetical protein